MPRRLLPALAALAALAAAPAAAADGNLDLSFWGDGRYTASAAPDESWLGALSEAPDGALVWAGGRRSASAPTRYVPLWRRLTDTNESVCELALPAGGDALWSSAVFDAAGRLVVGGWLKVTGDVYYLYLARYLYPSCALDTAFNLGGVVVLDLNAPQQAYIVALATRDNEVTFAANAFFEGATHLDGVVGRLLEDGELDPSFSGDGWQPLDGRAGVDVLRALALAPDGRVYAAGYGYLPDGTQGDMYLFALAANGAPVPGFGLAGLVTVDFGAVTHEPHDAAHDLALMPDGSVVLAGYAAVDLGDGFAAALARVRPDGSLDPAFGSGGRLIDPARGSFDEIVAQGDGRIVLLGSDVPSTAFQVSRRLPGGAPDPAFAGGVAVPVSFPEGGTHGAEELALQAGRVVLGGFLEYSCCSSDLAAVARLDNRYLFADGFEIGAPWFWSAAVP